MPPPIENRCEKLRISLDTKRLLRCPRCAGTLSDSHEQLDCVTCNVKYPISSGVPILVAPEKSLFDTETFTNCEPTFFPPVSAMRKRLSGLLPTLDLNLVSAEMFQLFSEHFTNCKSPKVLVIGGGIVGQGMDCLVNHPTIELVETDAAIAPRTNLVCDGHDLPFADKSFDGVIVQAVLEHVIDPHRCVSEIHRVLKPKGLVYSDTPFMQQVHGRQFDFTRFTRLGHRRLFRDFDETKSGISCGPGVAAAWSLRYLLLSFASTEQGRGVASAISRLLFWPLKYLDYLIVKKDAANDAASAFFFLGLRSEVTLTDRALVDSYQGGIAK